MNLTFEPLILTREKDQLVSFFINEEWPFHVNSKVSQTQIVKMIDEGLFDGSNHETFWINDKTKGTIGIIRLFDLDDIDDGYPLFDIRIQSTYRSAGVGKIAVRWLTKYLFSKHNLLDRIAGTTRVDNIAMRKTFRACGYVKEGHIRKDWLSADGQRYDTVKYGILREDWLSGKDTPVMWDDDNE